MAWLGLVWLGECGLVKFNEIEASLALVIGRFRGKGMERADSMERGKHKLWKINSL